MKRVTRRTAKRKEEGRGCKSGKGWVWELAGTRKGHVQTLHIPARQLLHRSEQSAHPEGIHLDTLTDGATASMHVGPTHRAVSPSALTRPPMGDRQRVFSAGILTFTRHATWR